MHERMHISFHRILYNYHTDGPWIRINNYCITLNLYHYLCAKLYYTAITISYCFIQYIEGLETDHVRHSVARLMRGSDSHTSKLVKRGGNLQRYRKDFTYNRAGGRSKIQPRQEERCQVEEGGGGGESGSFNSICKPKNLPRQLPGLPAGLRRPCTSI